MNTSIAFFPLIVFNPLLYTKMSFELHAFTALVSCILYNSFPVTPESDLKYNWVTRASTWFAQKNFYGTDAFPHSYYVIVFYHWRGNYCTGAEDQMVVDLVFYYGPLICLPLSTLWVLWPTDMSESRQCSPAGVMAPLFTSVNIINNISCHINRFMKIKLKKKFICY